MSLINEALKKAQALQDANNSAPSKGGADGAARRNAGGSEPSMRTGAAAFIFAGVALFTLLGIGLAVRNLSTPAETRAETALADPIRPAPPPSEDPVPTPAQTEKQEGDGMRPGETDDPPRTLNDPLQTVSPAAEPAREKPASTPQAVDAPGKTPVAENGSSTERSTPVRREAESARPSTQPHAAVIPDETSPATDANPAEPPPPAPVPEEEILAIIDLLEIRGIMADSKRVLIYDSRVKRSFAYGIGSTVSRTPLLKIREITPRSITFNDEAGRSFTKAF